LTLPFAGSTHQDRAFVATALHARYGGPAQDPVREPIRQLLDDQAAQEARTLGLALRLAYTLCAGTIELLREFGLTQAGGYGCAQGAIGEQFVCWGNGCSAA